jgi:hypothetical protein
MVASSILSRARKAQANGAKTEILALAGIQLALSTAVNTVASVAFRIDEADLILCYHDQHAAESRDVEQHVALSSVPAAFGGSRAYFLCPGADCGRRSSILYFAKGSFRCRRCQSLAYESQRENGAGRARRRADKFMARVGYLGWRPMAAPILDKPKGMWRKTFERLCRSAIVADIRANAALEAQLINLVCRTDRRVS